MAKNLVIVESPAKMKTVKKYIKMAKIGDSVTLQNLKSLKL